MAEDDFKERRPRRERGSDEPSKWLPAEEYLTNEVNPNEGLPFSRKWRLAVFGGSFDPVHLGHVKLARQVLEHDLADEILFVPAKHSPFKPSKQAETCDDRLEMLSLAIDDAIAEKPTYEIKLVDGRVKECEYRFSLSDIECRRDGDASYTYDTMMMLKQGFPDYELKFLMGSDCLEDLKDWRQAGSLIRNFEFLIYPRPGHERVSDAAIIRLYHTLAPRLIRARLSTEDFPVWDLSSSDIRNGIARGGDLSPYLTPSVWKYIQEHDLYK